ncbi:MAG: GreA/GreB family elongation factor [Myxococcota bacterium]|nr:GreA/GreB family elongation factor [Myxococcota bacterium]
MPRYMTQQGHTIITDEIDHLWRVERPRVVDEVSEAADLGDRSENAAYIYGKRRLRHVDSRLRYLRRKIDGVTVVNLDEMLQFTDIRFGAVVVLEDGDGVQKTWRLVDKDESAPAQGRISIQSPIGRALLGHEEGDCVTVHLPRGSVDYEVLDIRYGSEGP